MVRYCLSIIRTISISRLPKLLPLSILTSISIGSCKKEYIPTYSNDSSGFLVAEEIAEPTLAPQLNGAIAKAEIFSLVQDEACWEEQGIVKSKYLDGIYSSSALLWDPAYLDSAMSLLKCSKYDGLFPEDYDVSLIDSLREVPSKTDSTFSINAARLDVLLTNAFLKYGQHLTEGKTDPYYLDPTWNYAQKEFGDLQARVLGKGIKNEDLSDYVGLCRPVGFYYEELYGWMMESYSPDLEELDGYYFEYPGKPLRKGDSSDLVVDLKYRLRHFGAYNRQTPTPFFTDSLEMAVKAFQRHRGLEPDGIAGESTFKALAMNLKQLRDQVRVNMERARWVIHDLPDEFLLVNIAAYELYIFRNLEIDYRSNVIVGKRFHETPVFHSNIQYIEFNCAWSVPSSIAVDEILPKVKQNPDYLTSHHFQVLQNGQVVDPSTIDFTKYTARNFPYSFRQQPGPDNALGTMKFIFPNKYSVYLHDTPSRYLFEKEGTRAFSHGCVRVKNPNLLAEQLLKPKGMTQKDIKKILDSKETQQVNLKQPMPIFITYWTVYENQNGEVFFMPDVYDRDEKLLEALHSGDES